MENSLIDSLNTLLAAHVVAAQNIRGFHWNITGVQFFEIHEKLGDLYDYLSGNADLIAEMIRTLGMAKPDTQLEVFLQKSPIKSTPAHSSLPDITASILLQFGQLHALQDMVLRIAASESCYSIENKMADLNLVIEKYTWFWRSLVS